MRHSPVITVTLLAWAIAFTEASCGRAPEPPAGDRTGPPFKAVVEVKDLMRSVIDPAADVVWESVSTTMTLEGTIEHRPRTDEEWTRVRNGAVQLAESGNLLMIAPRAYDNDAWLAMSRALIDVSSQAIKFADARDADGLLEIGARIDEACEGCHILYAYENSPRRKK